MPQTSPAPTEETREQITRQGDSDSDSDEFRLSDLENGNSTTVPGLQVDIISSQQPPTANNQIVNNNTDSAPTVRSNSDPVRRSKRARQPNRRYSDSAAESELDEPLQEYNIPAEPPIDTKLDSDDAPGEYIIDKIVSHAANTNPEHPSAELGETVYRVRWHDYGPEDDTLEPIRHLPRNKVVAYHRSKKMQLPANIGDAQVG